MQSRVLKNRLRSLAMMAAVGAFFGAQAVVAQARSLDPLTPTEIAERSRELVQVPWHGEAPETDQGKLGDCLKKAVTIKVGDPINNTSKDLLLTVIRPPTKRPVPVVIVVPTVAGVTLVERETASELCQIGIASIIADVNDTSIPENLPAWGHEDETNRHSILSLRTTIDFAKQNIHFDPARVGLMGLSLGAVQSAFLAGLEANRLAAVVLVLAGGNLPYVMSTSDNGQVVKLREARMEHEHMTSVDEYESMLRKTMRYDPTYFASNANPKNIFMVISDNDTKVPTLVQKELFVDLGSPQSTTFSTNHVETIMSMTFVYFHYVGDFFKSRFEMSKDLNLSIPKRIDVRTY